MDDIRMVSIGAKMVGVSLDLGRRHWFLIIPQIFTYGIIFSLSLYRYTIDKPEFLFPFIEDIILIVMYYVYKVSLVLKFKEICGLLEEAKNDFWDWEQFPDLKAQEICRRKMDFIHYCVYFYYSTFGFAFLCICVGAPLTDEGTISLMFFYPEHWPYIFKYLLLIFAIALVFLTALTYDTFILTSFNQLSVQYTLLNKYMANLDFTKLRNKQDIHKCLIEEIGPFLNHHVLLIRYTAKVMNIIAFPYQILFFCLTSGYFTQIYKIFFSTSSTFESLLAISYCIVLTTKVFAVYSIPAQILIDEVGQINNSIYETEWYLPNIIPIRKTLILIMENAKNDLQLRSNYAVNLNFGMKSTLLIFKSAYSCYAFFSYWKNRK